MDCSWLGSWRRVSRQVEAHNAEDVRRVREAKAPRVEEVIQIWMSRLGATVGRRWD